MKISKPDSPAARTWFPICGIFAILAGVAFLVIFFNAADLESRKDANINGKLSLLFGCLGLFGGIGMALFRRSGAIAVALPATVAGISLGIGSIGAVPLPWLFWNLIHAVALLLPAWLLIRYWRELKW
tara:strand:+ start:168 stop:551 length:384 start_codon:yes stop_codon:yes gene_type:complete